MPTRETSSCWGIPARNASLARRHCSLPFPVTSDLPVERVAQPCWPAGTFLGDEKDCLYTAICHRETVGTGSQDVQPVEHEMVAVAVMLLAASTGTMAGQVETLARWSKQILSENPVKYTEEQQEATLTDAAAVAAHSIAADLHEGNVFARALAEAAEEDAEEVDEEVDVSE